MLYNWYAIHDNRNIAPTGWHVATDADSTKLEVYLKDSAASKLKKKPITHWISHNNGATNIIGFRALSGGYRYSFGTFSGITFNGNR